MIYSNYLLPFLTLFGATLAGQSSLCPNIIKRSSWNAQPAKSISYLIIPLPYMIIHHTVTPQCTTIEDCAARVRNIQEYHMENLGWDDIGFSFIIGGDGHVYEGVGWNKEGAHTYGYNKKGVGVAFIGNFQDNEPSQTMLDAAQKLITCGKDGGFLRRDVKILGGRQVISSLSPGEKLYAKIKQWPGWSAIP